MTVDVLSAGARSTDRRGSDRRRGGYVSEIAARACAGAAGAAGQPREGLRDLAELELGRGRRRGRGAGLRSRGQRVPARRQARDHRRQPAAALLGDRRDAGAGRRAGADLPGFDRRRDGLCARPCRGAFRGGRRPGAGRQTGRDQGALPAARKGDLLRSARHAALRPALARRLREGAGARPRIRPRGAGVLPR